MSTDPLAEDVEALLRPCRTVGGLTAHDAQVRADERQKVEALLTDEHIVETVAKVLTEHDYAFNDFGSTARRDGKFLPSGMPDPGWHGCRCGKWAGYWCDFRAHVARAVLDALAGLIGADDA